MVPHQAVVAEDGERFVFVVNDRNVIEKRRVVLGPKQDGLRVVREGLKPEEGVVVGRLEGLEAGKAVRPRAREVPVPQAAPPERAEPPTLPSVPGKPGPGVLLETLYPGADAQVVADAVRSPIEQQLAGLERIRSMRSRCTGDGKYLLAITFARGVDLKRAGLLVQSRAAQAAPVLPAAVQARGLYIREGVSGVQMIVNLYSADGSRDQLMLGNYANIQIKDELARLAGVGDVRVLGSSDYGLSVWIDPDRLAALGLNAGEVIRSIENQKDTSELDPEKLSNLVLKADEEGRVVRLRDVASIELRAGKRQSQASADGWPVAALVVYATGEVRPQQVQAAVRERLANIRARLPQGFDLDTTFDFTANMEATKRPAIPEYLLLDLDLPDASAEITMQVLKRCERLLRELPAYQHALALADNPFDPFRSGPCILLLLKPAGERRSAREEIIRLIRARLEEVTELTLRVRDLSEPGRFPRCGYPVDLAVWGPDINRVRDWAKRLTDRLGRSGELTDLWMNHDSAPCLRQTLEVNREAALARGIPLSEIAGMVWMLEGVKHVTDFVQFGRTWKVEARAAPGSGQGVDIEKLKIRNARGQMVPLSAFARLHETEAPTALDFLDLWPMVEITANPKPGVSADQWRRLCESLAEEVRKETRLSAEYRVTWLDR
jgi:multidrug efflux pump subunit AcrB